MIGDVCHFRREAKNDVDERILGCSSNLSILFPSNDNDMVKTEETNAEVSNRGTHSGQSL